MRHGNCGMKGAKGKPSESPAVRTVVVSPAKMTINVKNIASFWCSVSGNLNHSSEVDFTKCFWQWLRFIDVHSLKSPRKGANTGSVHFY